MPHIVRCNGGNHTISLTKVSWPTPSCDKSQFLLLWEEGLGKLLTRLFKVVASLVIFVGKVRSQTLLSFVTVLNACARIVAIEEGWTNQSRPLQVWHQYIQPSSTNQTISAPQWMVFKQIKTGHAGAQFIICLRIVPSAEFIWGI
jgi:hypothetical protein